MEKERLDLELLSLKKKTEMVMEISKMFTERALFFPKYASSKQVNISRYLSILKD